VAQRIKQWGALAGDLHTDMHEVIGHASGQLNPGVGTPDQTLKNYAGTLEEARADLVALYYVLDPKLVAIGVMPTLDVGKAEYDGYIMNGLMTQLFRIKPGHNLEEAHMRNRQLVAGWAFEKGQADKVIERFSRDGKTFFRINDYAKLRTLFGQLLREIQRIKSEGDFTAGKNLVENYGVKVDQTLLAGVQADRHVALVTTHDLGVGAGGAGECATLADLQLHIVDDRSHRHVADRHRVARLDVDLLAGRHLIADSQTLRGQDVGLLAVGITG